VLQIFRSVVDDPVARCARPPAPHHHLVRPEPEYHEKGIGDGAAGDLTIESWRPAAAAPARPIEQVEQIRLHRAAQPRARERAESMVNAVAQIEESVARYLRQLDSADRQEPSKARETKTTRLKEKVAKLKEEMQRLHGLKARMLATPDQQISLTDPDSRSMATSGRGSGVVGFQVAVDTEHHLIITREVTNVGSDRAQLAHMAKETKATLQATNLDVIADRGYFSSEEILECDKAGITVTLPKPMTSNAKRFGKQDFRYVADEDVYICPAGERLAYSFTTEEHGLVLRRYLTNVCHQYFPVNSIADLKGKTIRASSKNESAALRAFGAVLGHRFSRSRTRTSTRVTS